MSLDARKQIVWDGVGEEITLVANALVGLRDCVLRCARKTTQIFELMLL